MAWTKEARDEIADMLHKKMSASQIAAHFRGVSRNAVIGLVHRDRRLREIGFSRSPGPQDIAKARRPKRRTAPRPRVVHSAPPIVPEPEPEPITAFGAPHTVGIPLVMFNDHRCKWCINDPEKGAAGHLFCGETTNSGPYCAFHATEAIGGGTESERSADRALRKAA